MKLSYCIKNKFPKSGADRFSVWDECDNQLFDSYCYEKGDYDKQLLKYPVISCTVAYGPFGRDSLMCITIETGAKRMREMIKAATAIQQYCGESECDSCPFWKNYCVLRDNAPSGWDLSRTGGESE